MQSGVAPTDGPPKPLYALTTREMEVLKSLASGLDTKAISERLFISHTTVRNHVQSILRKLGVHRRLDAVLALLHPPG